MTADECHDSLGVPAIIAIRSLVRNGLIRPGVSFSARDEVIKRIRAAKWPRFGTDRDDAALRLSLTWSFILP
jgi:hypothetical protein